MKVIFFSFFSLLAAPAAFAQTAAVSGVVQDVKGRPVANAFVRDNQHAHATFTDSTGVFKLKADPASTISVLASGYKDKTENINGKKEIVVLLDAGQAVGGVAKLSNAVAGEGSYADSVFLKNKQLLAIYNKVNTGGARGGGGGSALTVVKEGFNQEPTRGSRYLYNEWLPGFWVNKQDSLKVEVTNMYNYDKMNGEIVYTNDGISMASVSAKQVKDLKLFDNHRIAHTYQNVKAVPNKAFVEILLNTPKYKIIKLPNTKLERADFHTNGVVETGNRYDEYVDNVKYYVVADGDDAKIQSISLKKSTLKKLIGADADAFMASQGSREVDEDYVRDLNESLNATK